MSREHSGQVPWPEMLQMLANITRDQRSGTNKSDSEAI